MAINSVLMVCMGNICRSPTAEAVLRAKAQMSGIELLVDSAGTIAHHTGNPPDPRAKAAGEKRGINFSGITARQVTVKDFHRFDLVLAADNANMADLMAICPIELQHKVRLLLSFAPGEYSEVPDPYYGGARGFELVLDLIETAVDNLLIQIEV